jgi:hypothetical protein
MASIKQDMEGGFNAFIKEQKALPGTCNVTLVQFDTHGNDAVIDTVYASKPIADVPDLAFYPRGLTPLLDAMGKTLADTQTRIVNADTKVVFMVITDGDENASREWTRDKIKTTVEACTKNGWLFQFLGANIDSFGEAGSIGIKSLSTLDYSANAAGVKGMYSATSASTGRYRGSDLVGEASLADAAFTEEERKSAKQ